MEVSSVQSMLVASLVYSSLLVGREAQAQVVDFQRDVRRILSRHCYQCHGPDEAARKAQLRLDLPEGAIIELGGKAISREDGAASPLLERIHSEDPDHRMPPPEAHRQLTASDREQLTQWIRQGAPWEKHWAYQAPIRPDLPVSPFPGEVSGAIDLLIHRKLGEVGLVPAPPEDPERLVRRLHFDLVGLPPSPDLVAQYAASPRGLAYRRLVDRLLGSPHFGERIAMYWFDLVRYANTTGIHADNVWHVSPYRNWVIDALNQNLPFDQFSREQIAGDLFSDADQGNQIASTYNRLNLSTREGGSQAKEFLAKYMADRVRNAGSVWLASSLGCAECHDHKFDPISTKEFYQFGAFFADIDQVGVYGSDFPPYLKLPTPRESAALARLRTAIESLEQRIDADTPALATAQEDWEAQTIDRLDQEPSWSGWRRLGPFSAASLEEAHDTAFEPESNLGGDEIVSVETLSGPVPDGLRDDEIWTFESKVGAHYFYRTVETDHERPLSLWFGSRDSLRVWFDGNEVKERGGEREVARDQDKVEIQLEPGTHKLLVKVSVAGEEGALFFRSRSALVPDPIRESLVTSEADRGKEAAARLRSFFRGQTPLLAKERHERDSLKEEAKALDEGIERTLATVSVKPMVTRVLPRGNWMDESGEVVEPAFPAVIRGADEGGEARRTRMDLANWLMAPNNPLTARVFVNRLWMLFFNTGLSRSVDDFGYQGEAPSHPALLDWLAVEFRESGWDVKHMIRLIVLSRTYQQSAAVRPELEEKDPGNRYYARQNRFRLSAEMIRDMYLSSSGLLNPRVGGEHVARPYQPTGYYRHLNFPKRTYQADEGEQQFRRGVYMHWQRQFLHPALKAFDAPTREECVAKRPRSNTPLAALVMMNDPSLVEAARSLALQVLERVEGGLDARLKWCFRQVLSRQPSERELAVLRTLWKEQREDFGADDGAVRRFLGVGITPIDDRLVHADLASWTVVARTVLNLHESILRP